MHKKGNDEDDNARGSVFAAAQMAAAKAGAALVRRGITFQSKSGQVSSPVRSPSRSPLSCALRCWAMTCTLRPPGDQLRCQRGHRRGRWGMPHCCSMREPDGGRCVAPTEQAGRQGWRPRRRQVGRQGGGQDGWREEEVSQMGPSVVLAPSLVLHDSVIWICTILQATDEMKWLSC